MYRGMVKLYIAVCLLYVVTDFHLASAQTAAVANDVCDAATAISTTPFNATGTTTNATPDFNELTCGIGATDVGVWYSYTSRIDTIVEVVVNPSISYTAKVTVFTGSCVNLVCADTDKDFYERTATWVATEGEEYRLLVSGRTASTTDFTITLREIEKPVNDDCEAATDIFASEPVSDSTTGAMPDFSEKTCEVVPTVRGVWYSYEATEDRIISIEISDQTTFRVVVFKGESCGACYDEFSGNIFQAKKSEKYFILVTGRYRFSDVGTFSIKLTEQDVPPNDACENAISIDLKTVYDTKTVGALTDFDEAFCDVTPIGRGIWFKYTPPINMNITAATTLAEFNHRISVFSGSSCDPLPRCVESGLSSSAASVTFKADRGEQYFFLIHNGYRLEDEGTFNFEVTSDEDPSPVAPMSVPRPSQTKVPKTPPTLPPSRSLAPTKIPDVIPRPVRTPSPIPPAPTILPMKATSRPIKSPVNPPEKSPATVPRPVRPPRPPAGLDPRTKIPSLQPRELPTISPRKVTSRPMKSPVTPPKKSPTAAPKTDSPTLSPSIGTMTSTCPDGSRGPKFPDSCEMDCPLRGPPPVLGCVKFCDVRPIFGCAPVCSRSVTAIVPGGCRERCCSDNTTDQPTSAPMENIIEATRQPAMSSNRPMRFPSGDDFGNGLDGVMNKYYNSDFTGWDERRRQWQMFRGGP